MKQAKQINITFKFKVATKKLKEKKTKKNITRMKHNINCQPRIRIFLCIKSLNVFREKTLLDSLVENKSSRTTYSEHLVQHKINVNVLPDKL